jgi:putative FmdB family regulatory protein
MPIYEYRCETCQKVYEQIRRMSEADRNLECPDCKSTQVERLISSFAAGGCGTGTGGGFT